MKNEENLEQFEDKERLEKDNSSEHQNQYSRYLDFIYYKSSRNPELTLAMRVLKPEKPSYILAATHGWHMSIRKFEEVDKAQSEYLTVSVDMRGRAHSDGKQDCNGWELLDVIDAIEYVKENYKEYIIDDSIIYFQAGSGGGGNAMALSGKFPDYFAHIGALSGISDYYTWYKTDKVGEFRDELDVWVGDIANEEAYRSRSGLTTVGNLCSPMTVVHGETDIRVPVYQSRAFVEKAKACGKEDLVSYLELEGIGGREHFTNITKEEQRAMYAFCERERSSHKEPVSIPRSGRLTVAGYIFTKHFNIILNSIDRVAEVEYDLDAGKFNVIGLSADEYELTIK